MDGVHLDILDELLGITVISIGRYFLRLVLVIESDNLPHEGGLVKRKLLPRREKVRGCVRVRSHW